MSSKLKIVCSVNFLFYTTLKIYYIHIYICTIFFVFPFSLTENISLLGIFIKNKQYIHTHTTLNICFYKAKTGLCIPKVRRNIFIKNICV